MKLLFVADPLENFKTYKDSTFAMMREAARRGHELLACEPEDVMWQRGSRGYIGEWQFDAAPACGGFFIDQLHSATSSSLTSISISLRVRFSVTVTTSTFSESS